MVLKSKEGHSLMGLLVSFKLLRAGCHFRNHLYWKLGLLVCCYDVFCQALAAGLGEMGWHFVHQVDSSAVKGLWDLLEAFVSLHTITF